MVCIAVVIAMPHRHSDVPLDASSEEVLEYSLGTAEIPWHAA